MRRVLLVVAVLIVAACDIRITGPTIDNNNNNNNTNRNDVHDVGGFAPAANPNAPVPAPGGGTETPLSIPAGSQAVATGYAATHGVQLAQSCQATYGDAAWQFLDGLVNTLKASDARWGYNVKLTDGTISRDVIAYRATSDNTGSWAIDVIVDHCGSPTFSWNVLGFDPNAQWAAARF